MKPRHFFLLALLLAAIAQPDGAAATSGPGCLVVVNVAFNDVLNMRAAPTLHSRIVGMLPPKGHGIIHLDKPCVPRSVPWAERWCQVTHYVGNDVTKGWVRARYVRDSDCP